MRILRNYILKEFFSAFFLSLFILTFVMIMGNMIKLADLIISKGISLFSAGKLFFYMIPFLFSFILPVSTLTAVLLSIGRLSGDNELIAIRSSGISLFKILSPIIIVGLTMSLFAVILNNEIIPVSHHKSRETLVEIGSKNPLAALEAGTFITAFEKFVIFIYRIDGNKFSNIRIYEPQGPDKPPRTIIAKKGEFIVLPEKQLLKLKLIDGTSDEINPSDPENFYKLNFKTYFMNIDFKKQTMKEVKKKAKDMTLAELRREIDMFKTTGINTAPLLTEIYKRSTLAFSCVIFIILGAPFAMITRRREKSLNFGFAFLIMAFYYLLLIGFETISSEGQMNPVLAMNMPNIIFGILGSGMLFKTCLS
ncbi:MAG: LptF/LptG family permease [Candidatus Omnitrophica bacterium]|nr:LptF/LptG family permease [Candidatus Omnitrophota bacterium]MDD5573994.1 LptF/LptG family permease [Candidatus Omnitrophota bacterium]